MHIQLDKNYTLSTDKCCFILSEYREQGENTKKPGKIIEKPIAFTSTLEGLLNSYRKTKALNSTATSFNELQETLNEIDENIKNIAAKLKL